MNTPPSPKFHKPPKTPNPPHRFSLTNKDFIQMASPTIKPNPISNCATVQPLILSQILSTKPESPPKTPSPSDLKSFHTVKPTMKTKSKTFFKISDNNLPPMNELILDDFDKKTYDTLSIYNLPPLSELILKIQSDNITENDFILYSYISYSLYSNSNDISCIKEDIINLLSKLPINKIDASSISNDRSVINMLLNCIIFSLRNEEIVQSFIHLQTFNSFIGNIFKLFSNIKQYRIKRKINGVFNLLFYYSNNIVMQYFVKFHGLIDHIKFGSVMVIKMYQMMKDKQKAIIDSILTYKNGIKDSKETITKLKVLGCFLNISEAELIYQEVKYLELFRYIRKNPNIGKGIISVINDLKRKIRNFL
jgi:hypothetical protein